MVLNAQTILDPIYDRTIIPVRELAEAPGATVDWIHETRTVLIFTYTDIVSLQVDTSLPDGMGMPVIRYDRTFVPVRYVAKKLGALVRRDDVYWAVYVFL